MTRVLPEAAQVWGAAFDKPEYAVGKVVEKTQPKMVPVDITDFVVPRETPRITLVVARRFFTHNKSYLDDKNTIYFDLSNHDFSLRKLRGARWANVILINISQSELAYAYPGVFGAIKNGCLTNKVVPTEIYV